MLGRAAGIQARAAGRSGRSSMRDERCHTPSKAKKSPRDNTRNAGDHNVRCDHVSHKMTHVTTTGDHNIPCGVQYSLSGTHKRGRPIRCCGTHPTFRSPLRSTTMTYQGLSSHTSLLSSPRQERHMRETSKPPACPHFVQGRAGQSLPAVHTLFRAVPDRAPPHLKVVPGARADSGVVLPHLPTLALVLDALGQRAEGLGVAPKARPQRGHVVPSLAVRRVLLSDACESAQRGVRVAALHVCVAEAEPAARAAHVL
eukprot:275067-Chlamydomonas_euryale.AAC.4